MGKPCLRPRMAGYKGALASVLVALGLFATPVSAQSILPPDFFDRIPPAAGRDMAVAADAMIFNQANDTVVATGNVGIAFEGYSATADRAIYYQRSGRVELIGNVAFTDPDGVRYVADRIELEDSFRDGFLQALTVEFPDGARFTAADANFDEGLQRIYREGIYAPCGECIGTHGGPIGWKVRATTIITDGGEQTINFEQPVLEFLGVSVAWLPWLTLPTDEDLEFPVFSYKDEYGYSLSFPFFRHSIAGGNLLFTPTVFSRQGLMLGLDWRHRAGPVSYRVRTSGIYQLDPGAFGGLGDREFRGALQTNGSFRPTSEWLVGWSAHTFTDPGYLRDYNHESRDNLRNEIYAQYLTPESYADIRVQQHVRLTDDNEWSTWDDYHGRLEQDGLTHPNAVGEHNIDLDDDMGRVTLSGRLLGLTRLQDHQYHGFVGGYAGRSVHAMAQAGWTNQYITGGAAISPYLGLRGDLATYAGESTLPGAPEDQTLFSATPIAALDVRYPLRARTSGATHIIEPIAQVVYRGSNESIVGIVNNDSHSSTFDTSSLFDFNRFSGADRQETGLRTNVGFALQTSFDNGAWLSASIGQSFHLAGTNAFGVEDGTAAGLGGGLDDDASYIVASLEGAINPFLSGGIRAQFDPETGDIPTTNARLTASRDGYAVTGSYAWADANPDLGVTEERHDIGAEFTVPLMDYWRVRTGARWDLTNAELLRTTAAIEYDDRFLAFGLGTRFNGPVENWGDDFRVELSLRLSTAGERNIVDFGYSWNND
ncbi:LPS-assembly protein LptD [Pelagibacterium lentulum]|uniref:LPS-assembly protein LptD n=2 Tax=Pelagibacterium lentulum TaxID=2029865 RepID=A0A916RCG4_9HYPH|nr:LPS-assembly protein LptD [Pelagibacterium lentulum]